MTWTYLLLMIGLGIVLALIAAHTADRRRPLPASLPVIARRVMTEPEQVFFYRLKNALPNYLVLSQVAASRLVELKPGLRSPMAVFRRYSQLTIDFVVCAPDSGVIAAIELDEPSHDNAHRRRVDERKTMVLKSAGIKLLRWRTDRMPTVAQLQALFQK